MRDLPQPHGHYRGPPAARRSSSPLGWSRLASGGGGPWKADSASAYAPPSCFLPGMDSTIAPVHSQIPTLPRAASPIKTPDGRTGTRRQKAQRIPMPGTCPQPRLRTFQEPPAQPLSRSRPPPLRRVPEKRPRSASGAVDSWSPQVMPVVFALLLRGRLVAASSVAALSGRTIGCKAWRRRSAWRQHCVRAAVPQSPTTDTREITQSSSCALIPSRPSIPARRRGLDSHGSSDNVRQFVSFSLCSTRMRGRIVV